MTYTEIKIQQKLTYLRRLLNVRVKLMQFVDGVSVEREGETIIVTWNVSRNDRFFDKETIEFPVLHLGRRIEHYRRKVAAEFKNRKAVQLINNH